MFQIRNNNIYLTRGDKATITLSIEDYTFKNGDLIQFKIYNKKQLNKEPIRNNCNRGKRRNRYIVNFKRNKNRKYNEYTNRILV